MLKHIGTRARQQIERILGVKVFLELFVKVREGWRDNVRDVDEAIDWRKQLQSLNTRLSDKDEKAESRKDARPEAEGKQSLRFRISRGWPASARLWRMWDPPQGSRLRIQGAEPYFAFQRTSIPAMNPRPGMATPAISW